MDISETIHLLGDLLGETISELESPALFEIEEKIRAEAKARRAGESGAEARLRKAIAAFDADQARGIAAAFATYFDLVNLAEENQRMDILRQQEAELDPAPVQDSIAEAIATLKTRGVTPEQMSNLLENLSIELVLTAHPTEARRRTVLTRIQSISTLLSQLSQENSLPREQAELTASLRAEISALWLTDRARTAKLAVTDEVRTGLYFVETVFWNAIPKLYTDLDHALAQHYPGLNINRPWFSLGSWMGWRPRRQSQRHARSHRRNPASASRPGHRNPPARHPGSWTQPQPQLQSSAHPRLAERMD